MSPSFATLRRYAAATGTRLTPELTEAGAPARSGPPLQPRPQSPAGERERGQHRDPHQQARAATRIQRHHAQGRHSWAVPTTPADGQRGDDRRGYAQRAYPKSCQ